MMAPTLQSLGIDQLTRDQRLELVEEICNSIAVEPQPPLLTKEQREELARRMAEDETTPKDVVSWEKVKNQTLAGLKS